MRRASSASFDWAEAARVAALLAVAGVVLVPLWVTVIGGFKTVGDLRTSPLGLPRVWQTGHYLDILASAQFWRILWNSLVIAGFSVVMTLLLASMAAYCFAQFRFLGSRQLYAYLLLGLMFPFATAILPLFIKIRDLGLLDSPWGVILPQVAFGLAFSLVLFRSFFEELPSELFDAARVDGCGYAGFFFRFTLPLSLPILSTVAVFVFVNSWNNFLLPLVVLNGERAFPWTLGMMQYRGVNITDWGRVLAFVTLTLAPALVFFVAAQRYLVAGLTGGAVKG